MERPFPFRKTMDPSWYASLFPAVSGKQCVVYKCVVEDSVEKYSQWLDQACTLYGHHAFNLVGAPTSSREYHGATLADAAAATLRRSDASFGCVCIPERHTSKGNENMNMLRKIEMGSQWFITQGIYNEAAIIKLLLEYGDTCRAQGVVPKKVVLSFSPCARPKTMQFIKWLGMSVPEEVEQRIFAAASPAQESVEILCEILQKILKATAGSGVPIGLNVESLSIFKEEIDAAHLLFQKLQVCIFFLASCIRRCELICLCFYAGATSQQHWVPVGCALVLCSSDES